MSYKDYIMFPTTPQWQYVGLSMAAGAVCGSILGIGAATTATAFGIDALITTVAHPTFATLGKYFQDNGYETVAKLVTGGTFLFGPPLARASLYSAAGLLGTQLSPVLYTGIRLTILYLWSYTILKPNTKKAQNELG